MNYKICSKCGEENPATELYCIKCGDRLSSEAAPANPAQTAISNPLIPSSRVYQRFIYTVIEKQGSMTKGSALIEGLKVLGMSLGIWVVFIGIAALTGIRGISASDLSEFTKSARIMFGPLGFLAPILAPILAVLGFALIIILPFVAVGMLIFTLLRKELVMTCPFCSAPQKMMGDTISYTCGSCGKPVQLAKKKTAPLLRVECPVCQSQWGLSGDITKTTCANCGSESVVQDGKLNTTPETTPCPTCQHPAPKAAYYCPACGTLLTKPDLTLPPSRLNRTDWDYAIFNDAEIEGAKIEGLSDTTRRVLSPTGHLARAAWLGETVRKDLETLLATTKPQCHMFTLSRYLGRLDAGYAHLIMAVELDNRLADCLPPTLKLYTAMAAALLKIALDPGGQRLASTLDSASFFSAEKQMKAQLASISAGQNYLAGQVRDLTGAKDLLLWPEPLFEFSSASAGEKAVMVNLNNAQEWNQNPRVIDFLGVPLPQPLPKFQVPLLH